MRQDILRGLLAFAALALGAPLVYATPITIPPGLNPGDTYFLAFVTNGARNATSPLITDYDLFVTTQANSDADLLALGTTWKVIGSTSTVSAATHLGLITSPIYNLAGQLVATGSADLFDGAITSPINYDQFGDLSFSLVWTGTHSDGNGFPLYQLGNGSGWARMGYSDYTNGLWVSADIDPPTDDNTLYGVSGPLVVPVAAVPEPATISLMLGPALLLFGRRQRRRRRLATRTTPSDPAVH